MSKNIDDLREFLFFAMEGLKTGKMDVEQARAMAEMGQTIINSAKVEVEAMKVANASGSNFLLPSHFPSVTSQTAHGQKTVERGVGYSVVTHRAS